jgi:hypothetical protein
MSKIGDQHTLYVISGAATNQDLRKAFDRALKSLFKRLGKRFSCDVFCNLIFKSEEPLGYGYMYVSNVEVYHMLLGRNPDGSDRKEVKEKDIDSIPLITEGEDDSITWFDWADAVEEIEVVEKPPLMELGSFDYSETQKKQVLALKSKLRAINDPRFTADLFDDDVCHLRVYQALVKPVDSKYSANVLCARKIPPWLTEADVYRLFRNFVHDKSKQTKVKGRMVKYPIVNLNERKRIIYIEFDPTSNDAAFALKMTTKVNFTKRSNPKETETVIFCHKFRNHK